MYKYCQFAPAYIVNGSAIIFELSTNLALFHVIFKCCFISHGYMHMDNVSQVLDSVRSYLRLCFLGTLI